MFALDLSEAPLDVLCAIFAHLPARDAFVARLASRRWSHVSELSFAARCAAKGSGSAAPERRRGDARTRTAEASAATRAASAWTAPGSFE